MRGSFSSGNFFRYMATEAAPTLFIFRARFARVSSTYSSTATPKSRALSSPSTLAWGSQERPAEKE